MLDYYNRELRHIHETALEFANAYPRIARRLGLEGFDVKDPYVERLLDGFAYMAARVRLKVDAEFPRFTQHLLEMVYPLFLSPTPSMGVVQFLPDLKSGSLKEGYPIPRQDSVLRTVMAKGDQTACEYRTAHDVMLWPLRVIRASYLDNASAIAAQHVPLAPGAQAAILLRLELTVDMPFSKLALDSLPLFLRGGDQVAMAIYEQFVAHALTVAVRIPADAGRAAACVEGARLRPRGFDETDALMPPSPRFFHGYRLLQEYFAFAERFLFVELSGLQPALRRCDGRVIDVIIQTSKTASLLAKSLDAERLALFCTPVVNLFPKRADPIPVSDHFNEYHIVADRSRPTDYEVFAVTSVRGWGADAEAEQEFLPFYACNDQDRHPAPGCYYSLHRELRVQPPRPRKATPRSQYVGSEMYVSLVDSAEAPFRGEMRYLSVATLCTNRDLPVPIATGDALAFDFAAPSITLETGAPVDLVRFVSGPTAPRPPAADHDIAWKLISHLALNYMSLVDTDASVGAAAVRELLTVYVPPDEPALRRQVEGIVSIACEPVWRRLPLPKGEPVAFGRGLQIRLMVEEAAFEGFGAFLLGAVLEQFFARYVAINAFSETVLCSTRRGEIMRWPARVGQRHLL